MSQIQNMNAAIQFMYDSGATWDDVASPVPHGMWVYDSDTRKLFEGDGTSLIGDLSPILDFNDIDSAAALYRQFPQSLDGNSSKVVIVKDTGDGYALSSINVSELVIVDQLNTTLANYAQIGHDHDNLYYTKAQVDGMNLSSSMNAAESEILSYLVLKAMDEDASTLMGLPSGFADEFEDTSGIAAGSVYTAGDGFIKGVDSSVQAFTGGTVSASSEYEDQYFPEYVFDNPSTVLTTDTVWEATQPSGTPWIMYDFGEGNGKVITGYIFESSDEYQSNPYHTVYTCTFEGSTDGENWDQLDSWTGWPADGGTTHTFDNDTMYRYYRWNVLPQTQYDGYWFPIIGYIRGITESGIDVISTTHTADTDITAASVMARIKTSGLLNEEIKMAISRDGGTTFAACPAFKSVMSAGDIDIFTGNCTFDSIFGDVSIDIANSIIEDVSGDITMLVVDTENISGHFDQPISDKIVTGCTMTIGEIEYSITSITGDGTGTDSISFTGTLAVGNHFITGIYGLQIIDGALQFGKTRKSASNEENIWLNAEIAASVTYSGDPNNVVDGASTTSATGSTAWRPYWDWGSTPYIEITLAAPRILTRYCVSQWHYNGGGPYNYNATGWRLEGFNGNEWVTLDTRSGETDVSQIPNIYDVYMRPYDIAVYEECSKFRLYITEVPLSLILHEVQAFSDFIDVEVSGNNYSAIVPGSTDTNYVQNLNIECTDTTTQAAQSFSIRKEESDSFSIYSSGTWRDIVHNNAGTWEYWDTDQSSWIATTAATAHEALTAAAAFATNRMTKEDLQNITSFDSKAIVEIGITLFDGMVPSVSDIIVEGAILQTIPAGKDIVYRLSQQQLTDINIHGIRIRY